MTILMNSTFQYMQQLKMQDEVKSLMKSKPIGKQLESGIQYLIIKENEDT